MTTEEYILPVELQTKFFDGLIHTSPTHAVGFLKEMEKYRGGGYANIACARTHVGPRTRTLHARTHAQNTLELHRTASARTHARTKKTQSIEA